MDILFSTTNLLTLCILISCLMVISSNSAVSSVLYLIFTFIFVALYLCALNIPYLGLTYIIIYVGAIIVLLLFVIIIINLNHYGDINSNNGLSNQFLQIIPLISLAALIFVFNIVNGYNLSSFSEYTTNQSLFQIINDLVLSGPSGNHLTLFSSSAAAPDNLFQTSYILSGYNSQIQSIALELYTHQSIWLILISFVLIISIIGPIVICKIK